MRERLTNGHPARQPASQPDMHFYIHNRIQAELVAAVLASDGRRNHSPQYKRTYIFDFYMHL
jgi:hypothetical protein